MQAEGPDAARTIPALLLAATAERGDAPVVEDADTRLTTAQLAAEALRAARAFTAAGVQPGDRVAIWAPNIPEWIVACLGLQCAGAVLVPINTRWKGPEAAYVLRKSRARVLCTLTDFLDTDYLALLAKEELPDLAERVVLRGEPRGGTAWEAFLARGEGVDEGEVRARAAAVDEEDLSDLMFTSGTTGRPKGVMATHGQTLRVYCNWSDVVGLRGGDRYLIVNPFFHTFGYKAGWLACLLNGATALPHAVFDAASVLERVVRERVSVLPGPPTLYQSLLAHPERAKYDLSCLRLAVTGAAAIPVELIHRMRRELGFETVVTAYGLTESTGMVSICRREDDPDTIATTSGRAIPGVAVRCVDDQGREVPRGESGEIVVRGYNVMRGYFEDEPATREAIDPDGWLHTGDVGVMDARGYLRITDRIKDMFIVGGFNCYPAEIENALYGMDGVAHAAVIGVRDERLGEVGMAFVVPEADAALTPDGVIAWCREHMANYKVPRRVEIVDALPTNASGKVTKFVLRERAAAAAPA